MNALHTATFLITALGAINWGLAAFDFNVVHMLLTAWPYVERAVYVVIALSGLYQLVDHFSGVCRSCSTK